MQKLSIIWDMTDCCPFNCPICCMGAKPSAPNTKDELQYGVKYSIVGQLRKLATKRKLKVDLSGGELMTDLRNLEIAEEIAHIIGKENVGISTSGYGIDDKIAQKLSAIVSEVELTMDTPPGISYRLRPLDYAKTAAHAVPLLKKYNISTGIQTVLTKSNSNYQNLKALYEWLCLHNVDEWSLLRFYPSGRGANFTDEILTDNELLEIIHYIQTLDSQNTSSQKPKLHFHYTMKGHEGYTTECRCVKKSIGIFPNGDVTACFWASDHETHITDKRFYLGNIQTDSLSNILENSHSCYWQNGTHTCPFISDHKED